MKKIIILLLLGSLVLTSCNVDKQEDDKLGFNKNSEQTTNNSEELNITTEREIETTITTMISQTTEEKTTSDFSAEDDSSRSTTSESEKVSSITEKITNSESVSFDVSNTEVSVYEGDIKAEKESPLVLVKGNTLFTFDFKNENINELKKIDFDFYPNSINSVVPILVGQDEEGVFTYGIINDEKKYFFICPDIELRSCLWSNNGENLVFNLHYKEFDKNVIYIYNRLDESIVAVDMADNSNYCWSYDDSSLLISQKTYKKSSDKYEFRLNRCELGKSVRTVYKVDGANGNVYPLINYASEVDDKAYILLRIYDENDISSTYVYDFNKDELESYMAFDEAYDIFMERYNLDSDICKLYSQLGKWLFPNVIEDKSGKEAYISDGISFFYYPDKTSRGEVEIGNYKHIIYTNWEIE